MKKILLIFIILVFSSCGIEKGLQKKETITTNTENEKIILALGDSLTAGYNLNISDSFPSQLEELLKLNNYNYKVKNAGVSGDTSQNLLDRIKLYDEIDADIYLIGIGANDGLRRQSIETMKANINKIIDHLQSINPDAKIIIEGMQMPLNAGLEYSQNFKQSYIDLSDRERIYFYSFLLQDVATKNGLNLSDGIHPNKQGYTIIAQNIYNFLAEEELINK